MKIYKSNYGRVDEIECIKVDGKYYEKSGEAFYRRKIYAENDFGYFVDEKEALEHALDFCLRSARDYLKRARKIKQSLMEKN